MEKGRDILNEYGPDNSNPQKERASRGGVMQSRDVMGYSPPIGPTTFGHNSPGLAERNNYGNAGSQGKYSLPVNTSGAPGVVRKGGTNEGEGSQHG